MCRELMYKLHEVKLQLCDRLSNQVADVLAKNCRTSDMACNVYRVFHLPPAIVKLIILRIVTNSFKLC